MQFKLDIAAAILFIININIIDSRSDDIWHTIPHNKRFKGYWNRHEIVNNEPSCSLINATIPAHLTILPRRNCMCDEDCRIYKDCCKDSVYYNETEQLNKSIFQCHPKYKVYMVASCPPGYYSSIITQIRERCENPSFHVNAMMRNKVQHNIKYLFTPVSDTRRNIIFANLYCASCHNERSYIRWNYAVKCFAINDVPSDINISSDGSYYNQFQHKLKKCFYNITPPDRTVPHIRSCVSAISTCEINKKLQNVCDSYTAYVRDENGTIYKNADCAQCNNATKTWPYYVPSTPILN